MKKNIILLATSALIMLVASCQKTAVQKEEGDGMLSFENMVLSLDETVETKASAASGNYTVSVLDNDGTEILRKTYAEIKENGNNISIAAGTYTLVVSSSDQDVPEAAFENPIYGTTKSFSIVAGEVTAIGELVCTLVQCKVTVAYSDEFLEAVTGDCSTTVTLKAGYPLEYSLTADGKYDQSAGYFAVEGNTMEVEFKGMINGKSSTMRKTILNVAAKQWRQIKFVQKQNEQGNGTFEIEINDLISDATLNSTIDADAELILGQDPDKPKGDGGITLVPDYDAGCDDEITDLSNMLIVPTSDRTMAIKLKATVPNGIRKFIVKIDTDNSGFANAVAAADATTLDLIYPSEANAVIFQVVPFPHGEELLGLTEVAFDLSAAQEAIINYKGNHTFSMEIMDQTGCQNTINVTMVVE